MDKWTVRSRFMVLICGWLLCLSAQGAASAQVKGMRVSSNGDETRVVLSLSAPVKYHLFQLDGPPRVVVDIPHASLATTLHLGDNPLLQDLRSSVTPERLRLVFDVKPEMVTNSFLLAPDGPYGQRLVIDFLTHQHNRHKIPTQVKKKERNIVIVIDAGHGGKDPGATGAHKVREKDVVLAIAQRLYKKLQKEPGFKAVMTRSRDNYVSLRGRLDIARHKKGDAFVAIHADAFKNRRARGASVFALSQRGASSEAARWIAEKENYSELGGVRLDDKTDLLRSVLIDLSQTSTIASSLQFGQDTLDELAKIGPLHGLRKVEQARFVVLKSPDIPSILVETGFISNPSEEARLRNSHYQDKIADALLKGIKHYFAMHPLPDTWYAHHRTRQVIVRRGDSLSKIAHAHHVSANFLISYNHLNSEVLNVGQVIVIPS